MKISVVIGLLLFLSLSGVASRTKHMVEFNIQGADLSSPVVPFTAEVPSDYSGYFVRFVHLRSGKSVVARVVKRSGNKFKTNKALADALGIKSDVATLFVEDVY